MNDTDAPRDYLTLALRRMRLPISVSISDFAGNPYFILADWELNGRARGYMRHLYSPESATRAYLDLVRTLDPTAV